MLKTFLPASVRRILRAQHRRFVFWRAMRRFRRDPDACAEPGSQVISDLIYGWGNEAWSALDEYLVASIKHASAANGAILECGSGLSTLLVGIVAQSRGVEHWALENSIEWAERVKRQLSSYHVNSVTLCCSALKDYGEMVWYDPPLDEMPSEFALVICDGPPGKTKGGRVGLVSVMRSRLAKNCVILLDDASRPDESRIAKKWEVELNASVEKLGQRKPYIRLTAGAR